MGASKGPQRRDAPRSRRSGRERTALRGGAGAQRRERCGGGAVELFVDQVPVLLLARVSDRLPRRFHRHLLDFRVVRGTRPWGRVPAVSAYVIPAGSQGAMSRKAAPTLASSAPMSRLPNAGSANIVWPSSTEKTDASRRTLVT